ncbi:MAG: DUF488 domain-containing protein [Ignavibacteriaceae bacterium]
MEYQKKIWTIGHSTRSIEEFVEMLLTFNIEVLVDVRSFPGSKRFPQFNKENLAESLLANRIEYVHILRLGGRRTPKKDSKNTGWKHKSFRGYADYMETEYFKEGIDELIKIAGKRKTVIMCSEAVWWKCHRSMISDYLKLNGWTVLHIMDKMKADEHPYTQPAKILNGKLDYAGDELF